MGEPPPQITLGCEKHAEGQIKFWVTDNGKGLNPKQQAKMFQEFTRFDQQKEGHGIGLSIVQRVASKLGGEVGMESQENVGSTFYFILPVSA